MPHGHTGVLALQAVLGLCRVQDDGKALTDYGVHSKSRMLVMRTAKAAASAKLAAQESRAQRLARLKDAAAAVAARGDGR